MTRALVPMLALGLAAPAWSQQPVATLAEVHGSVTYTATGGSAPRPAKTGAPLSIGDSLLTDFESGATIGLPGGNRVQMFEMSQVRVDQVFRSGDTQKIQMYLDLGRVETLAPGDSGLRNDFSIVTPTAIASIRGTRQLVSYAAGQGTRVQFLEGHGATRSNSGRQVAQKAGQKSSVSAKLRLTGPEESAKQATVPDLCPPGRDDTERAGARDYNRLCVWPVNDPTAPTVTRNAGMSGEPPPRLRFRVTRTP
jgi:hypothetical protein